MTDQLPAFRQHGPRTSQTKEQWPLSSAAFLLLLTQLLPAPPEAVLGDLALQTALSVVAAILILIHLTVMVAVLVPGSALHTIKKWVFQVPWHSGAGQLILGFKALLVLDPSPNNPPWKHPDLTAFQASQTNLISREGSGGLWCSCSHPSIQRFESWFKMFHCSFILRWTSITSAGHCNQWKESLRVEKPIKYYNYYNY